MKAFQTEAERIAEGARTDIGEFYRKMIQDAESEIESLQKGTGK